MTIKDVAKKAGVSVATVSRVVHNYKWVSPEIRERVQKIIDEEHYQPNYISGVMATGKSNMIVIVVPDIKNPFFAQFTSTAIKLFKDAGYFSIVHETDNCSDEEISFFGSPFALLADGIISVTDGVENEKLFRMIHTLLEKKKPILFIDRLVPNSIADCVVNDNLGAMYKSVKHLYERGHKKIALITGKKGITVVHDKIAGFRNALASFGLTVCEDFIRIGDWDQNTGKSETAALLDMEVPPTAIIACNNFICEGAVEEIERRRLKIGEDISLIGTEESDSDERLFKRLGITTLRLDSKGLGVYAGKYILDRLKSGCSKNSYTTVEYSIELIERNSVSNLN